MLSAEQLAMRSTGIGGSEAPVVAGVDPYGRTKWWLYGIKTGLFERLPATEEMELGNHLEAGALSYYAKREGVTLAPGPMNTVRHPERPWQFATPDALVLEDGVPVRSVQVKCLAGWNRHVVADPTAIPDGYRVQVEWEMDCLGLPECDFVVLLGGRELFVRRIRAHAGLRDALVAQGRRFWFEHVVPRVPPPLDGSEYARRAQLERLKTTNEQERRLVDLEADRAESWARYAWASEVLAKHYGRERERALQQLRELLGSDAGVRWGQGPDAARARWIAKRGNVSWKNVALSLGAKEDDKALDAFRGKPVREFSTDYEPSDLLPGTAPEALAELILAAGPPEGEE